jgi:hypothetical protein
MTADMQTNSAVNVFTFDHPNSVKYDVTFKGADSFHLLRAIVVITHHDDGDRMATVRYAQVNGRWHFCKRNTELASFDVVSSEFADMLNTAYAAWRRG